LLTHKAKQKNVESLLANAPQTDEKKNEAYQRYGKCGGFVLRKTVFRKFNIGEHIIKLILENNLKKLLKKRL